VYTDIQICTYIYTWTRTFTSQEPCIFSTKPYILTPWIRVFSQKSPTSKRCNPISFLIRYILFLKRYAWLRSFLMCMVLRNKMYHIEEELCIVLRYLYPKSSASSKDDILLMCLSLRNTIYRHEKISEELCILLRYGVATISRLLKIIGLFCRIASLYRALLQKRPMILRSLLILATP